MFCFLRIIKLKSISITEMTEEMITAKVPEELVVVHKACLTELAERVALVRRVIGVSLPPVGGQLRPSIQPSLVRENLTNETKEVL